MPKVPKVQPPPLSKVKVLDLTHGISGPFCSMILGDLGADIYKIEFLPHGDPTRRLGPFEGGESVYFQSINRNKRSLALNVASTQGKEILQTLVGKVDVLLENDRPGALNMLGLDDATLKRCNPSLIHTSITGYGPTGPYSQWPWAEVTAQGYSGLMHMHNKTQEQPLPIGLPIANLTAGMWSAIGVLSILLQRRTRFGNSQASHKVEVSLLGALVSILSLESKPNAHHATMGDLPHGDNPRYSPYGVFSTKDSPISLAVLSQEQWVSLCQVMKTPTMENHKRYATNGLRLKHRAALRKRIETILKKQPLRHWVTEFNAHGVPAGQIHNMQSMFEDEHVVESGMVEHVELNSAGIYRNLAHPVSISGIAASGIRRLPPTLGEHSLEMLWDAGFSKHHVQDLANDGIVLDGVVAKE